MSDSNGRGRPIGVGIIGLGVSEGWASAAHVPALATVEGIELRALAASTPGSARAAAEVYEVRAHASAADLASDPDVDLVVIAVKVPLHRQLLLPVLEHGAPVFTEWPLALHVDEAHELRGATAGQPTFIGLQGRSSPTFLWLKDLMSQRYVGKVLSATIVADSNLWGGAIPDRFGYMLDRANGATMLTVSFAHNLDLACMLLGRLDSFTATTATRHAQVPVGDDGRMVPMTAEDQIALTGTFGDGAVLSVHHRGGVTTGSGFTFIIDGTDGTIEVSAPSGYPHMGPVTVRGSQRGAPLETLEQPVGYDLYPALAGTRAHVVAHEYARIRDDLIAGTTISPDFADAVKHHELIDAISRSAASGRRMTLSENGDWVDR